MADKSVVPEESKSVYDVIQQQVGLLFVEYDYATNTEYGVVNVAPNREILDNPLIEGVQST